MLNLMYELALLFAGVRCEALPNTSGRKHEIFNRYACEEISLEEASQQIRHLPTKRMSWFGLVEWEMR